jgi:uncharacterized protein involved in propanediol utilization
MAHRSEQRFLDHRVRIMDHLPGLRPARQFPVWRPHIAAFAPCVAVDTDVVLATATRASIAQHGELLQGQLQDAEHRYRRFLISLPCDRLYTTVTFVPSVGSALTVEPAHKTKLQKVVKLALERFGLSHLGGLITVDSNIPEGKGYGSSTADCVAGALAAADAVAGTLTDEEVAQLVVAAEIASDNFMFNRAVLFAHREGIVLAELGPRLPRFEVLGIDTDVSGVVRTLEYPPAVYDWRQIQYFQTLVAGAERAIRYRDLALLGRVATSSAIINQRFLPKPMFSELCRLAECVHALGVAVAHSGTVLSMLFDPSDPQLEANIRQAYRELETLGMVDVLRFHT